ncbi:hypothetical protein DEJ50_30000 [Streptomyces venezuelae]|uniref:GNAT family N-acetyltransferase n=1 Tax=Streptomyces venezuelae TaxID=54571 RepID=A0A5P2DEF1_STRVZ|nr:hypothetical protein [Streptomyces venezuelae]QES51449.1 hypothetical protein DEJ50_30000 [Streptomyces venezuelae]
MTLDIEIRDAVPEDARFVEDAVLGLLHELAGTPKEVTGLRAAFARLTDSGDPDCGALVAMAPADRDAPAVVDLLTWSRQTALRVGGDYFLIQELWTHPAWRSLDIAARLMVTLRKRARAAGLPRIEVGLPGPSFPAFARTEAYYLREGFREIGPRMTMDVP